MRLRSLCGLSLCGMVAWTSGCTVDTAETSSGSTSQPLAIASTTPAADEERIETEPSEVTIEWAGVPDDGAILETRGTSVGLVVANTSDEVLSVRLVLTGDDGSTGLGKVPLGTIALEPRARHSTTLDLARLGLDLRALPFSGRAHVTAFVEGADGPHESAVSNAIYYHSTSTAAAALTFYGEMALRRSFRSGDYRGTIAGLETDPDRDGLLRIADIGSGNTTGDEGNREAARLANASAARMQASTVTAPAAPSSSASTNVYKTCLYFRTQTIDSGIPIGHGPNKNGLEDYRVKWNDGRDWVAYGGMAKLKKGSWEKTIIADPDTGCFTWYHDEVGAFEITVYAYSSNSVGAKVRTHNAPSSFAAEPGTPYSEKRIYLPTPNTAEPDKLAVGSYSSEFTATAAVSLGLKRLEYSVPFLSRFDLAIDNATNAWSSAHWGQSNSYITQGRHYIKVANIGEKRQTRRKFLVAHELGHALAALDYGSRSGATNGGEPNVDDGFGLESHVGCTRGPSYSIRSEEWNSVGFREGFAHFIAAAIMNDEAQEGSFHWLGTHHDLERYRNGLGTNSGGYYENACCLSDDCPKTGTIEDWMLFFWDYFTTPASVDCPDSPSMADMLKLYSDTRLLGGLTRDNYFSKMREASLSNKALPKCVRAGYFDTFADWNGINN